jgi:hypothetical protein
VENVDVLTVVASVGPEYGDLYRDAPQHLGHPLDLPDDWGDIVRVSIEGEYQAEGEMFHGGLYAQAHDEHDQEWNLLFLASFLGWMTEETPLMKPIRRIECFVHEQASQYHPEVLAKDLVTALEQKDLCRNPLWVAWHRYEDLGIERRGIDWAWPQSRRDSVRLRFRSSRDH